MPDRLTIERFHVLASAYGANIARWPRSERRAARVTALEPEARVILDDAAALDDDLDLWRIAYPSRGLLTSIVRTAPSGTSVHLPRRARLWWSAIGLAATLAGAGAGALAASALAAAADAPLASDTAFSDLDGQGG